ncbi:hypothetical protein [Sphingomicrobium arenosum]|uniref:hypothetical protein n=1 Tax=Sphingomicrobium arenosum TaxID=2233861 RepID=UPI002240F815|nr:hypothetical protein [Sphingomicrobium arenosum]
MTVDWRLSMMRARAHSRRGFDWWWGTVEDMLPLALRQRLLSRRPVSIFRCEGEKLFVQLSDGSGSAHYEISGGMDGLDNARRGEVSRWVDERKAMIALRAPDMLQIDMRMPKLSGLQLEAAIENRLLVDSPIVPDALHWTWRLIEVTRGEVVVRVWIARRDVVARRLAQFTDAGFTAPSIMVDTGDGLVALVDGVDGSRASNWWYHRKTALIAGAILVATPLVATVAVHANMWRLDREMTAIAPEYEAKMRALRAMERQQRAARKVGEIAKLPSITADFETANMLADDNRELLFLARRPGTGLIGTMTGSMATAADRLEQEGFTAVEVEERDRTTVNFEPAR